MVVLFALAGSFAVYFAYRETRVQRDLKRHGTLVRGRVVRHHDDSAGRGSTATFAIIEFTGTDGVLHTFQAQSSGVKRLAVGEEVPVRYRADYPTIARIDLAGKKRANILIPLLVGALFFGGAVAMSLDQGGSHAGHGR
ncbi:uncharacterized protein DUF3592 [Streptomyces sp. KhCrAH-43]|uniref:DUF3592 domain-containing protein n=1 Tax=unclassified Streptomyces TaxID=2593676 RepID=UPI000382A902|nr:MULTISPECIES: DUF3592 domain-containing protein [unclassified Streptomyces]MYS38607.1 DUF3592 domain-containing protein [Streptomyces sp. SID4920]MYX66799.1 DUF3592 domain-containing protein [Streptomyces sp. SID8373]RAJ68293.1 uncharacterized protein DUF3592 [Streptomyces sp. KhCrAH-43]